MPCSSRSWPTLADAAGRPCCTWVCCACAPSPPRRYRAGPRPIATGGAQLAAGGLIVLLGAGQLGVILTGLAAYGGGLGVASGARVLALAGGATKLDHARRLGAAAVVDHRAHDGPDQLRRTAPHGIDVVFDGIGAGTTEMLFPLVNSGGRYLPHGAAGGAWGEIDADTAARRSVTIIPLSVIGDVAGGLHGLIDRALDLTATGALRATIGQTFPLADTAAAHTAIEARRTVGKTLLLS